MSEVLKGLEYFHENGLIHRDVKASNILLNHDGSILLGDFGTVARLGTGDRRTSLVGSPLWMAPEVLAQSSKGYNTKVDVYSFGVFAIEIAEGKPPNSKMKTADIMGSKFGAPEPALERPKEWSREFQSLVK